MDRARTVLVTFAAIILSASICQGDSSSVSLKPSGYSSIEFGQIVRGRNKQYTDDIRKIWTQKIYTGFTIEGKLNEANKVVVGLEMKMFNEFPREFKYGATRRLYFYPYVTQVEYSHSFGDDENPWLRLSAGYFPFKYNKDVRNLGEYLFRSGTYPQYLIGDFDFPFARLVGVHLNSTPLEGLRLDGILFSNQEWIAVHDFNIALLGSYSLGPVEVGAGVTLNSFFSVDHEATAPRTSSTRYVKNGDTLNYTFEGTKVMGRISLDPKQLFPSEIFGENDFKLYAEATVLGVKNYPISLDSMIRYDKIAERIPLSFGFNFPTLTFLDVLNFECEVFGNRYPNNMDAIVKTGLPLPFPEGTSELDTNAYKKDNVKWSIYASKTIGGHYRIIGQAASDHLRTFTLNWNEQDWEEAFRKTSHWYYMLKFMVMF